ncbi:hypothetical protein SAMN05443665_103478 [Actinomadura meyerae]|jgi:hypothetical protein|uniref:Uncharacterized protein n=1 Tax=Actinomadura meyerae TaxID=240840 RepID=A0A239N2M8_9ACTN|nr:hypothetical protein [Actinomadura meyerae]SNT48419.1 hypothetical protein SAMN05443665_103478 [Actinomadura meyerae]
MDAEKDAGEDLACPSGRCREGAVLLGIMTAGGTLGYLSPVLPVDREFVARAERGGAADARFRFAEPCIRGGCGYWTGTACGLIDGILETDGLQDEGAEGRERLPKCGIRRTCRWFRQRGPQACRICPLVTRTS